MPLCFLGIYRALQKNILLIYATKYAPVSKTIGEAVGGDSLETGIILKIDQGAAAHRSAQKNEDPKELKKATTARGPRHEDFKALLARASEAPAQGSARNEFGARLRDGRVQVGEQAEASLRTRAEREAGQGRQEQRLERRELAGHVSRVGREARDGEGAQKARQIGATIESQTQQKMEQKGVAAEVDTKMEQTGAPAQRAATPQKPAVAEARAPDSSPLVSGLQAGGVAQPVGGAEGAKAGASDTAQRHAEVAKIARELVDKAQLGTDTAGRQIMMLELQVPGRGQIRVRLRRRGDGFELRMRPQNQELARDLRQERYQFRQAAAGRGVTFSSIEIV